VILKNKEVIAIIRNIDPQYVVSIAKILTQCNVFNIEVSLSNEEQGLACLEELSSAFSKSQITLGAGTIIKKEQVAMAKKAGAAYIITPGWNETLVSYILGEHLDIFPGAFSPGEIARGIEMGIETFKIFPAGILGPSYIKSLRGPFPDAHFMAVGGVNASNVTDFYQAGCSCFAFGSDIIPKNSTDADLDSIQTSTEEFMSIINRLE